MTDEDNIPLHRKLGIRFLQFLIVVLAFVLIKNCINISMTGENPELELQQQYYEKGYEAGKQKGLNGRPGAEPHFPDLLLERKYRQGYRDGWDETNHENNTNL